MSKDVRTLENKLVKLQLDGGRTPRGQMNKTGALTGEKRKDMKKTKATVNMID